MKINEVFTPNDQPTVTYVQRSNPRLEAQLRMAIQTPKMVTSISGPSKTGKTVLIKSVLDEDNLIYLRGAYLKDLDGFWRAVLSWFEAPSTETITQYTTTGGEVSATGGGEIGLPLVAKGKVDVHGAGKYESGKATERTVYLNPYEQIVREIANSDFTIFLDDYHYMPVQAQSDIAKVIKSLAESNVRICTALVPHRAEDVLKSNSELKGRLVVIEVPEWERSELEAIGNLGFNELNIDIAPEVVRQLSELAMGSPQLMQVLCMNLCAELGIHETVAGEKRRVVVSKDKLEASPEISANFTSSADLVQALHSGPKVKGQPRTQYDFTDGSRGDVYRALLLAISKEPVARDFTYDEVYQRVRAVCVNEAPTGQSISQSLNHMCTIAASMSDGQAVMEWDDANLHIADPYLAFYMRASPKIDQLRPKRA